MLPHLDLTRCLMIFKMIIALSLCTLLLHRVVQAQSPDEPRQTPLTRPEMKQMLEDMKKRPERIPTSNSTESLYEARLTQQYLPQTAGARSYLNFSGSPAGSTNPNRPQPDPAITLDYAFKTRMFWIAARVNNCQYCLGHQETKLLATGMTDDQIAALDSDWSSYPANEQAAFGLARKLTLEPYGITDADIDALRPHYNDLQILEIILSVSGNNAINRWKEGIGTPQSNPHVQPSAAQSTTTTTAHTYLTETNPALIKLKSKILAPSQTTPDQLFVPTKTTRTAQMTAAAYAAGLANQKQRKPRLPLATPEQTQTAFADLVGAPTSETRWLRLLANFPIAGKRQAAAFISIERDLDLDATTRQALAHTIARQNGAWYSLSLLGDAPMKQQPDAKLQSLLTVAEHLASSPVVLTDADVSEALKHWPPRELTQAIHYTAMRCLFDRVTEAAGL